MSATGNVPSGRRAARLWVRRLLVWGFLLGVLTVGGFVGWFYVLGPQPPEVTLSDDPDAASDVAEARSDVKHWPFRASKWGHLGFVLREYDFHRESIACFARAAQLSPSNPHWPYLQGDLAVRWDLDAGRVLLERSVRLDPPAQTPRLALGETLLRLGRGDEAEEHFQFVLEIQPENARALFDMGRAASEHGDLADSLDYLERSADNARGVKATHELLAEVYERNGNKEVAKFERTRARSLHPASSWPDPYRDLGGRPLRGQRLMINRASHLLEEKQAKKALEMLNQLATNCVQAFQKQVLVGRAQLMLGDFAASERAYREALGMSPDRVEVLLGLAQALEKQDHFADATDYCRKAMQLKPDDAESHYHLGRCLKRQGQSDRAVEEYRESIRLQPGFASAHKALGSLLQAGGQDSEALAAFETACELVPKDRDARQRLITLRERIRAVKEEDKTP